MTKRALALFAKHPTAMPVKTRLIPPLTAAQASTVAAAFLDDSIALVGEAARRADAAPCVFWDPPAACEEMRRMLPAPFRAYSQTSGDLSDRLEAAYAALVVDGFQSICFVGSDSPTLPRGYIERAFAALDTGHDIALGPATDGGYYLVGLRGAHVAVFDDIAWSTERVFEQTRAKALELGLSVEVLDEWYDVDDAAGLERLRQEVLFSADARAAAPKTAAVLDSLYASDRTPRITFT